MATQRPPLARGDRVVNFFLPDPRDVLIGLYDKVTGGPIVLLLVPALDEARGARETARLVAQAPKLAEAGAHVFLIAGDPVPRIQALAKEHDPSCFVVSDADGRFAALSGVAGELVAFVLDANQRVLTRLDPTDGPLDAERLADRAFAYVEGLSERKPQTLAMHPPVLIVENVLEPEFCRYLIEQYEARGNEESGTFRMVDGRMVRQAHHDVKRRRDHIVADDDLMAEIGGRLERRLLPEIRRAFQANVTRFEEFKIVCYDAEPGGYFHIHRDNTTPQTRHRRFAMTLNLNGDEYEGGYLRFPEFGDVRYKPPTGAAVVFSCNLLHEALDVTNGRRFVLLSFFYDEAGQKQLEAYEAQVRAGKIKVGA